MFNTMIGLRRNILDTGPRLQSCYDLRGLLGSGRESPQ